MSINLEIASIGAGVGGDFDYSSKLKVLNFKQAIASIVKKEYER